MDENKNKTTNENQYKEKVNYNIHNISNFT